MTGNTGKRRTVAVVTVEGVGRYEVPVGMNLREGLRYQGLYLDGSCGDRGTCGRCVVRILSGEPAPASPSEAGILGEDVMAGGGRLACQVPVPGDLTVGIDPDRILELDRTGRWKEVQDSPLFRPGQLALDGQGYGVALDLGTTSVAAALFDLGEGRLLDLRTAANPQLPWGDEIITRLEKAVADDQAAAYMKDTVWETVNDLVGSLARRSGISPGRITRLTAVGNSAVHHLALGLDPAPLVTPPFAPSSTLGVELPAAGPPVRIRVADGTVIRFLPLIGGYAGSDALSAIMAARMGDNDRGALLDVGTNTEVAVWNGKSIKVATAPSGPAFEGGHIRSGMRAEEGAVWRVRLEKGGVRLGVIGEAEPRGICGTGIVDAVAGMRSLGILDRGGLIDPGIHPSAGRDGLTLHAPTDLRLEPPDIETVQKAKAAVAATFRVVLDRAGLSLEHLDKVYLSGAFGSRLDVANAVSIGLLPPVPEERYKLAGNAALVGASMALLSTAAAAAAEALSEQVEHVSVAEDPAFEELFIQGLYFDDSWGQKEKQ